MANNSEDEVITTYLLWRQLRRRSTWVRDLFLNREHQGEFHLVYPILQNDDIKFQNYYRMSKSCFSKLVQLVEPNFVVGYTNFRKTISFLERLTVTLRFLATGESFASASYRFRISPNEISIVICQMLDLIYKSLKAIYLKFPKQEDWYKVAEEFKKKKYFPNCIGAIDGKHIRIRKPKKCGSLYYNYKLYHSIVLLSVVDVDYRFVVIDVGSMGRNSDGGIFENSNFGKLLNANKIEIPPDSSIETVGPNIPYVFIGDEAFRLSTHFMKPYPRRQLDSKKKIFNYRLSFARSTVECAFGILVSKFRVFENTLNIDPSKVDNVVLCAAVLHNLIRTVDKLDAYDQKENINTAAFSNINSFGHCLRGNVNSSTVNARLIRDHFAEYFSGPGKVPWQNEKIYGNDTN